ncbi:hypothetical protein Tsubulata_001010 [Turnera subulata]|uniref:Extradiol ring-cleavage dioxygenase class III enzyme subunit B domain-containing protein n=1 Tax=Turnera subulata TaxID=218843 RepID=A0A9Q0J5P5_9ROSI|nr:hypothetical protein Tsubulata_001010 [Turnera subulata]
MKMMETFYLSHGSPTLSIDDHMPAWHFFRSWQQEVLREKKPTAILVVSAHWDSKHPSVNVVERNETIHDFYNFPEPMYRLRYNPPGSPDLARRVKQLLLSSPGLTDTVVEDKERGVDHGAWVPLMLMIGQALGPLREEGVLILGSGSAVHNLRALLPDGSPVPSWASEFDTWLRDALLEGRYEEVVEYEVKAPHAKKAHPWRDHFYPLHVAMGAAGEDAKAKLIHHSWGNGSLSYASYQFTPPK